MKVAWINDIHLDFLDETAVSLLIQEIAQTGAEALLIAGDIGQARSVTGFLRRMREALDIPLYFVLGNHDYYHGAISEVRHAVQAMTEAYTGLHWMNTSGPVPLTPEVSLIGHDGWGDGRFGDYAGSTVELNDFNLIADLKGLSRREKLERMKALGDEAAAHLEALLPEALKQANHVVALTHVPPFVEAAWYKGRYCTPDFLPFFSCKAVGDVLVHAMKQHPRKNMTVLCGHTHGGGVSSILPNLTVKTGSALYGDPKIQEVFDWK